MTLGWSEKTFYNLQWPSMTFRDLPCPSMTFHQLLWHVIKTGSNVRTSPVQSCPNNSHLTPRLVPSDSKSSFLLFIFILLRTFFPLNYSRKIIMPNFVLKKRDWDCSREDQVRIEIRQWMEATRRIFGEAQLHRGVSKEIILFGRHHRWWVI